MLMFTCFTEETKVLPINMKTVSPVFSMEYPVPKLPARRRNDSISSIPQIVKVFIQTHYIWLYIWKLTLIKLMVVNTSFYGTLKTMYACIHAHIITVGVWCYHTIFQQYRGGQFYMWKKSEDSEKTADIQVAYYAF